MIVVEIQNSWQMDQLRLYRYRTRFREYYYNHVIAEVFKKASRRYLGDDLIIFFNDNHFSNVDNLDYRALHEFLIKFFRTVKFVSDGVYDYTLAPDYFSAAERINNGSSEFVARLLTQPISRPAVPAKMFGYHILRPDAHRLGMLVEFQRQDLLQHVDVRLGFRSQEFGAPEYRRASNIDLVCFDFDIGYRELCELIDSLLQGDRTHFKDGRTHKGPAYLQQDLNKSQYADYAIEIIGSSTVADHVYIMDEKLYRCFVSNTPYIPVASANMLAGLHALNFRSFAQCWDESWDKIDESMMPAKLQQIAQTCRYIVDNYSTADIAKITQQSTDHNRWVMEHYEEVENIPAVDKMIEIFTGLAIKNNDKISN